MMPELNGQKFSYTKEGMRKYKLVKRKETGKKQKTKSKAKGSLSTKQKQIAAEAGDKNKIEAADMKALREKKKPSANNEKKQARDKVKSARKYLKEKDGT